MREQLWVPDTHPNAAFVVRFSAAGRRATCVRATVDGIEQADPQAVYQTALAENRLKNEALNLLAADERWSGAFEPQWRFGALDGRLEVCIPGLSAGAGEGFAQVLAEAFGDRVRLVAA